MKNISSDYIEGTAALNPLNTTNTCSIIPFGQVASSQNPYRGAHARQFSSDSMIDSLRYESAKGIPFDRVPAWQAAITGFVFMASALICIFIGC